MISVRVLGIVSPRRRAGTAAASRALLCWVVVAPLLAGCTFERRDEVDANASAEPAGPELELPDPDPLQAAVRSLRVFREAVAVGDLSLALSLLDRDAVLIDALAPAHSGVTRGELLLELRRLHGAGLVLEVVDTEASVFGDAALVLTRLAVLRRAGDSELAVEEGRATETVVLTAGDGRWRIRHMHRSLDLDP